MSIVFEMLIALLNRQSKAESNLVDNEHFEISEDFQKKQDVNQIKDLVLNWDKLKKERL